MPEFLRGWEVVVLLLVFLVFFGAKRMPDAARGLGRSLRILKAETKGLRDDDDDATVAKAPAPEERPASLPIEQRAYATDAELRAREAARVEQAQRASESTER